MSKQIRGFFNLRAHIVTISILCTLITACSSLRDQPTQQTNEKFSTTEVTTTQVDFPDYLAAVWPLPEAKIDTADYNLRINNTVEGGVGARFRVDRAYRYFVGQEFGVEEYTIDNPFILQEHVELQIDGEKISSENLNVYDLLDSITIHSDLGKLLYQGSAHMDLMWRIPLSVGEHTASLRIYNSEKKSILEYIWKFSIVD